MNKFYLQRSKTAFTLVELLLGLLIFSIIGLCVVSAFWSGIKLSHRAETQNAIYREVRWVFDSVSREMESMIDYQFANSYSELSSFLGDSRMVRFVLPLEGKLKVITYSLSTPDLSHIHKVLMGRKHKAGESIVAGREDVDQQIQFMTREEQDLVDFIENNQAAKDAEIVSTRIKSDGLRFFYSYLENEESTDIIWQEQWDEPGIPSIIRMEIDFLAVDNREITLARNIFVPTGVLGIKQKEEQEEPEELEEDEVPSIEEEDESE